MMLMLLLVVVVVQAHLPGRISLNRSHPNTP
jgi:hypothetical protein